MSERKYRQRGYQDEDRERPSRPARRRASGHSGPSGRGLGAPTDSVFRCARCGQKHDVAFRIVVDTVCRKCGEDLHTCTNCRHFDTSAANECREPVVARIARKSTRNDCELFEKKTTKETSTESARGDDAKSAFDALFDL